MAKWILIETKQCTKIAALLKYGIFFSNLKSHENLSTFDAIVLLKKGRKKNRKNIKIKHKHILHVNPWSVHA